MPRTLIYAPLERNDLEAITHRLTQPGSGPRARRRLAAIWAAIERLRDRPCRYPVGQHRGVRELPCDGATGRCIAWFPTPAATRPPGDVRVLRVFGPGQSRNRF